MRRRTTRRALRSFLFALTVCYTGCRPAAEVDYEEAQYLGLTEAWSSAVTLSDAIVVPPSPQSAALGPRLIRSGSARIEVQNLEESLAAARELGSAANGFVAGSALHEGREGARTASLTLRVPSDSFDGTLERLADLGRVLSVSVFAEDVSRDYLDVETRLRIGEETVVRLRELASRGGSLEDLLAAERELGRAVAELESLRGQIRFYDLRVAESDLALTLVEPGAVIAAGAFRPLVEALRNATDTLVRSVASVIYVAAFVLPWLVLTILFWFAGTHWRRARLAR